MNGEREIIDVWKMQKMWRYDLQSRANSRTTRRLDVTFKNCTSAEKVEKGEVIISTVLTTRKM